MRLAVLDVCVWLEVYQYDQPRFGDVVVDYLKQALPEAQFTVVDVGQGAALPTVEDYEGYIVSGSEQGVYDDVPWMAPLKTWLQAVRAARVPVFGVCFGHQVMAEAFGGKAEHVGPAVVGVRQFEINGRSVAAQVWHKDQVTEVPPGARVIGAASYCPVGVLAYDFPALSVQFHPEYPAAYLPTFIERSRGDVLPPEQADLAIAELSEARVAPDLFAEEVAAFFRSALERA